MDEKTLIDWIIKKFDEREFLLAHELAAAAVMRNSDDSTANYWLGVILNPV